MFAPLHHRGSLAALMAAIGLIAGLGIGITGPSHADDSQPWAPASARAAVSAGTIVEVTGDRANGFTLYRLDGDIESPPTSSEARAECGEYSKTVKRVRCRAEVRQWYADLAVLRDTIDYYQRLFD